VGFSRYCRQTELNSEACRTERRYARNPGKSVLPLTVERLDATLTRRPHGRVIAGRGRRFAVDLAEARDQFRNAQSLRDIQQVALNVRRLMRGEAFDWRSAVRRQDLEPP